MALETQWLNQKFHAQLNDDIVGELANFLLFWSLFEKRFCKQKTVRISFLQFSETNYKTFSIDEINTAYLFFKERYVLNPNFQNRFDGLKITSEELRNFLIESFADENATKLVKVNVCLNIIYRYRNNLFHGSKEISFIHEQADIFRTSNRLLKYILDTLID